MNTPRVARPTDQPAGLVAAQPGTIAIWISDDGERWTYRHVLAFELVEEYGDRYWTERVGGNLGLELPDKHLTGWEYAGLAHVDDMDVIHAEMRAEGREYRVGVGSRPAADLRREKAIADAARAYVSADEQFDAAEESDEYDAIEAEAATQRLNRTYQDLTAAVRAERQADA